MITTEQINPNAMYEAEHLRLRFSCVEFTMFLHLLTVNIYSISSVILVEYEERCNASVWSAGLLNHLCDIVEIWDEETEDDQ